MADPEGNFRIVDLKAAKSEHEWGRAVQAGVERAAATWFKWIGWILTTGALGVLGVKTGDPIVKALEAISLLVIWIYFTQYFGSIRIEPITSRLLQSHGKGAKALLFVMILIVSALPPLGVRLLTTRVIELLRVTGPR